MIGKSPVAVRLRSWLDLLLVVRDRSPGFSLDGCRVRQRGSGQGSFSRLYCYRTLPCFHALSNSSYLTVSPFGFSLASFFHGAC
jgi:hypothetical protein